MSEHSNTPTPLRARRQGQRLTAEQRKVAQERFLEAFGNTANVRAACLKAGIDRSTVYRWQEVDETFGFRFKQAEAAANDLIRAALWRRGVDGVDRYVISQGKLVYVKNEKGEMVPLKEKEYSDSLLALLAKARMPEFRDKSSVDVNASIHGTVQHVRKLHALSDEELDLLEQLAAKAQEG